MPVYLTPLAEGRRIPLDKAIMFIGRHPDCDVVLSRSRKISRRHCCIAQVNNTLVVRDLGSTNGVRINGELIRREASLKVGDAVAIGDVEYTVEAEPKPGASKQRTNGESASRGRGRDAPREPSAAMPARPINLSQNFPVPIDDEDGDEIIVLPSARDLPQVEPSQEHDSEGNDEDDVILLDGNGEPADSDGSHAGLR